MAADDAHGLHTELLVVGLEDRHLRVTRPHMREQFENVIRIVLSPR